jgi:transposase
MNNAPDNYIKGLSRIQTFLLPETIDEYIAQENEARFIDAFVDSLNLKNLGFTHAQPNNEGRPPYNPADMLRLFTWATSTKQDQAESSNENATETSKSSG